MNDDTMTRAEATPGSGEMTETRWVAFGATGAVGTIHRSAEGYGVRMLDDDRERGSYPSLEVAKNALHAAMPPGSDWPEFREH
ncbi:MAG: hypothetical protein J0G30_12835 [Actinomycetales bacterium]|nr:hypothetical protein [Actinomycetales bacterium]